MNCTDEQKASLKRCLEDGKWRTKIKPIFKDIIFDSIGTYTTAEKINAWKEVVELFDNITKE